MSGITQGNCNSSAFGFTVTGNLLYFTEVGIEKNFQYQPIDSLVSKC